MAMASPPSVIKLAESPSRCITMNVIRGVTMSEAVTTTALRTWPRKKKKTKITSTIPSIKASRTVLIAAVTNSMRS